MRFYVTNKHNGERYPAEGQHWPEHGWHIQIHDLSPGAWGRATTGVGAGSVIDQGFQEELEKRGWEIPPDIGGEWSARDYALGRSSPPKDVRDQELQRLAKSFMKPTQEALDPNVRQRVKVPPPHFCECGDPGCPVCHGHCRKPARTVVYRRDMEDEMGAAMCEGCAEDCIESGVFYTKENVAYKVVDALINEEGATAAGVIEALKPKANVPGVSKWEKRAGRKVEAEHATDNKTRDTIASQHHKERKDYYKRLKQSGLAPELSVEPLKEPPGSPADLKMPKPKAAFYPSNGGPSSI